MRWTELHGPLSRSQGNIDEHPTEAMLVVRHLVKPKVLPLTFYSGKDPADNPYLPRAGYRPTWG